MSASSDWPEVLVATNANDAESIEDWLFAAGALSVTFRDQHDQAILEPAPGEVRLWDELTLVGLFAQDCANDDVHAALLLSAASQSFSAPSYTLTRLQDTAWERTWMDSFHPMQFGKRFWVCPSHCEAPDSSAVVVRLDPGLAFGSGTHATTAQCLHYLGQHADHFRTNNDKALFENSPERPSSLHGKDVIDYGCGSGILAVAAALLGASSVRAVDIDPQAIEATRRNADANGVASVVDSGLPSLLSKASQCDLLLANILCEPLLQLAPEIAKLVRRGGTLVMSGVLLEQIDRIRLGYNAWFEFDQIDSQDDWALLVAIRRP